MGRLAANCPDGWGRFMRDYHPLLLQWAREHGLNHHEAEDLISKVMVKLVNALPRFAQRYDPAARFRGWLRVVVRHEMRDHLTARRPVAVATGHSDMLGQLGEYPDPALPPDLALGLDEMEQYKEKLQLEALARVEKTVEDHRWQAFVKTALEGRKPAEVAEELGLSIAVVYKAKSSLVARVREEFERLQQQTEL